MERKTKIIESEISKYVRERERETCVSIKSRMHSTPSCKKDLRKHITLLDQSSRLTAFDNQVVYDLVQFPF